MTATELSAIQDWETWTLGSNQAYSLTLNTSNADTGALAIDASAVTSSDGIVKIDGSAETNGGTIQLTVAGTGLDNTGTASVLTGGSGGRAKEPADFTICVTVSDQTPRIQETLLLVIHLLCEWIEWALFPSLNEPSPASAEESEESEKSEI